MSPEAQKTSEHIDLKPFLLLGGFLLLSQFAFSSGARSQILNRDKKDVWTNETENLEAAHITHDKRDPRYNSPENGRMLTRRNHYIDHYNREGRNGLTIPANNAALRLIWKRLSPEERQGLPEPPEEQDW